MPREPLLFTLSLDGVGDLDVVGEAVLVWLDGADDPAENGWCCDRAAFVSAILHEEGDVSRPVCEASARALCTWDSRDLDVLLMREGEDAADRLWGERPGYQREEDTAWAAE